MFTWGWIHQECGSPRYIYIYSLLHYIHTASCHWAPCCASPSGSTSIHVLWLICTQLYDNLVAHFSGEFGCVHLGRVLLSQEDNSILYSTTVAIKALKSKHEEQVSALNHAVFITQITMQFVRVRYLIAIINLIVNCSPLAKNNMISYIM